jgi:hypothetical protein
VLGQFTFAGHVPQTNSSDAANNHWHGSTQCHCTELGNKHCTCDGLVPRCPAKESLPLTPSPSPHNPIVPPPKHTCTHAMDPALEP